MEKDVKMLTLSELKLMGFTPTLIARLLPPPTLKTNPRYKCAAPMKLYPPEAVEAAIQSPDFQAAQAAREKRKAAAAKAAATKRANLQAEYAEIADCIQVEVIPMDDLRRLTINAKQAWYNAHDQYGHYERCAAAADDLTVARWMVNYVRHNLLSRYDLPVYMLQGRTGKNAAYISFKCAILQKIAIAYPDLAEECDRQRPF